MKLDSYAFTNKGGRSENQDTVGTAEIGDCSVFVVADGLGGHRNGEQASACAVGVMTAANIANTIIACLRYCTNSGLSINPNLAKK